MHWSTRRHAPRCASYTCSKRCSWLGMGMWRWPRSRTPTAVSRSEWLARWRTQCRPAIWLMRTCSIVKQGANPQVHCREYVGLATDDTDSSLPDIRCAAPQRVAGAVGRRHAGHGRNCRGPKQRGTRRRAGRLSWCRQQGADGQVRVGRQGRASASRRAAGGTASRGAGRTDHGAGPGAEQCIDGLEQPHGPLCGAQAAVVEQNSKYKLPMCIYTEQIMWPRASPSPRGVQRPMDQGWRSC